MAARRAPHLSPTLFGRGLCLAVVGALLLPVFAVAATAGKDLEAHVSFLSAQADRSSGTPGARVAADYIRSVFEGLDLAEVGGMAFAQPVRRFSHCRMEIGPGRAPIVLAPFIANAVAPDTLPPDGLAGHLIYAGRGTPAEFNGRTVKGAIVLMELDSGAQLAQCGLLGRQGPHLSGSRWLPGRYAQRFLPG